MPPPGSPPVTMCPRLEAASAGRGHPVGEVLGKRWRGQEGVDDAGAHDEQDPLRVARTDGDCPATDVAEHEVGVPGDDWPCRERAQDGVVVVDPGGVVRPRPDLGPRLDVGTGEGNDARRAARAGGLIDALDALRRHAGVAAERRGLVDRGLELVLGAEWQLRDVGKVDPTGPYARLAQLARRERRVLEEVQQLPVPGGRGEGKGVLPASRLNPTIPDPVALALISRELGGHQR